MKINYRKSLAGACFAFGCLCVFSQENIKGFSQDDARGLYFKWKADSIEKWSFHFQLTTVVQGDRSFNAKYSGKNSLSDTAQTATSLTTTIFLGRKLWKGAAVYFDPEITGGQGMSYAVGLAGASNGETYRIGDPSPQLYVGRLYYQQVIALRNSTDFLQGTEKNQLGDRIPNSRLVFTAGKFQLSDYFDDNNYSHDPRTQFLNWALMENGAWDYPANTRGYTSGFVLELINPVWAARVSAVLEPKMANNELMDPDILHAHGLTGEVERNLHVKGHPGTIRLLGFYNVSRAVNYRTAITAMAHGDSSDIALIMGQATGSAFNGIKYGFGLSYDQELTKNLGIFSRVGWNDGQTSTWAFTEIDQTATAGISIKMNKINRPSDTYGLACIANGISNTHRDYLNAGGYGFILGDGKLTNYGLEQILETYYSARLALFLWLTVDYQFVVNPAYNQERGPVNIFSARAHVEF